MGLLSLASGMAHCDGWLADSRSLSSSWWWCRGTEEDREELVLDHRHQRMDPSSYEQPLVLPAEFFSKEIVVSELERRANEPNIVAHTAWSAAGSSTAPAINASLVQDQEADHVVAAISRIFKGIDTAESLEERTSLAHERGR